MIRAKRGQGTLADYIHTDDTSEARAGHLGGPRGEGQIFAGKSLHLRLVRKREAEGLGGVENVAGEGAGEVFELQGDPVHLGHGLRRDLTQIYAVRDTSTLMTNFMDFQFSRFLQGKRVPEYFGENIKLSQIYGLCVHTLFNPGENVWGGRQTDRATSGEGTYVGARLDRHE